MLLFLFSAPTPPPSSHNYSYLDSALGPQVSISWWYWIYRQSAHWACRGIDTGSVAVVFNSRAALFISRSPNTGTASSASFSAENPTFISHLVPDLCPCSTWGGGPSYTKDPISWLLFLTAFEPQASVCLFHFWSIKRLSVSLKFFLLLVIMELVVQILKSHPILTGSHVCV